MRNPRPAPTKTTDTFILYPVVIDPKNAKDASRQILCLCLCPYRKHPKPFHTGRRAFCTHPAQSGLSSLRCSHTPLDKDRLLLSIADIQRESDNENTPFFMYAHFCLVARWLQMFFEFFTKVFQGLRNNLYI